MPPLDIVEDHFAKDPSESVRPQLLSKASHVSVFSNTTTALTQDTIDEHTILENREGRKQGTKASLVASSRASTTHSIESELAESMSQLYEGHDHVHESRPKQDIEIDIKAHASASSDTSTQLTREEVSQLSEEAQVADFLSREKHFLILSAAGKPIYSRHGTGQVISGYMGIIQAIMGFYQDSSPPDTLQAFSSPGLLVVMLVKGPVYLVAITRLKESESTLRAQLDFLYQVVVSGITSTNMARLFDRGDNFDLGRLLSGSETFLDKTSDALTYGSLYLDVFVGCLSVFKLRATLRSKLDHIIAAHRPPNANLLYAMVAVDKKLASILRPKGHSMHPVDLQLVFETVWERGFEEGQEYWLPLCLPKFNSTGFLHLFVSFLAPSVAIILISADKDDFFSLQQMKQEIMTKMMREDLIRDLIRAKFSQTTTKSIGIDEIVEHFIFKSRSRLQYLAPSWSDSPSVPILQQKQIYTDLQTPETQHKVQILYYPSDRAGHEVLALSWLTQSFECYVIGKPTKITIDAADTSVPATTALIGASNAIHHFVRAEEGRVWLNEGLTF